MKSWMKILMWLGLGAGFGYFIGDQMGYKRGREEGENYAEWLQKQREAVRAVRASAAEMEDKVKAAADAMREVEAAADAMREVEAAADAMREYASQSVADDGEEIEVEVQEPPQEDVDEEPADYDVRIDPDIPQLHPTHLTPEIIGEEEYNANIWNYDLENLIFYELDEVLYNETTQSIIENPDDVVGIGTLFEFGGDPNNPTETIYVKNETFGVLFRIDRLDAAFCDAVDGTAGPTDDEEDDFWDDV